MPYGKIPIMEQVRTRLRGIFEAREGRNLSWSPLAPLQIRWHSHLGRNLCRTVCLLARRTTYPEDGCQRAQFYSGRRQTDSGGRQ